MDEQRLDQLLSSNSSLHPLELSLLRQDVQVREDAIQRLQSQIETLISQCQARKSLLSPLRRSALPLELLGEIFCEVLEESDLEETDQVVTICLVCRAWRNVALATPRLWVSARVRGSAGFENVNAWLSRSCALPKELGVHDVPHWGDLYKVCPVMTSELANFLAEGPALEKLTLKCQFPKCFHGLLKSMLAIETKAALSWDSLKSLDLDVSADWGNEGADFFHLLPRSLTTLSFSLPYFEELPDAISRPPPISHPSVSTLKITSCFWPAQWVLKTLIGFTRLSEVTLDFQGTYLPFAEGPFPDDEPHNFPGVRSLKLYNIYWHQSDKMRILRFFSMPCLAKLEMSFETDDVDELDNLGLPEMGADISQFAHISNNLPLLHFLRLQGMTASGEGLNRIFKSFPSVTHLVLETLSIHYTPGFRLGFDQDVLPQLQTLEILDFPSDELGVVSLDTLMEFIQTRSLHTARDTANCNPTPIRKATISIDRSERPNAHLAKRWFKIMKEEGVDFSFVSP